MHIYGYLNLPWWGNIVATLIMTHLTITSVTLFLHRNQAHRSVDLHPIVSHFCRFWLWMSTGMVTKAWTAIHRKHHAKCETVDDPHSPQVLGLAKVMWEGAELYRREAKNIETMERFGKGTPDDWLENNVYIPYSHIGIFIMMAINVFLFGVPGLSIWALQMAWIPFHAAGIINGVGHYWGYRNVECQDAATNILPWGIWIGGEELHNNHHAYPTSAKFSVKWWEFDIGWAYIQILSFLGLAKVKRVAPHAHSVPGKSAVDAETLRAIIANRFHVFTQYSKDVILPIFSQEKDKLPMPQQGVWKQMKRALLRETSLVAAQDMRKIEELLEANNALKVVYTFRKQLQAIWEQTHANQRELLEALHDWCARAEHSGIVKLQEFTDYLKGYALVSHSA